LNATLPFGADYARAYDSLYADKDYPAECALIERLLRDNSSSATRSILDLGCGTGRHATILAERGYDVLGVDRSPHMIERGRGAGARLGFSVGDIRTFRSPRRFDAALMMFAVLGYQLEDEDVVAALRTARVHLTNAGLLLFDCWHGPAVLHQQPSDRVKTVKTRAGEVRRQARSRLDVARRRIDIDFDVEMTEGGATTRSQESHAVRFFFAEDIERFLAHAGFTLVRIGVLPQFEQEPDESTWNVLVLARASAMMRG